MALWWSKNAESPGAPIRVDQPDVELYTDASMQGTDHNIHLSASHITGSNNVHADHAHRNFVNPDSEL